MKKKLVLIFALCFAFSTVVHAEENLEIMKEIDAAIEVETIAEPEFSLVGEAVIEIAEELVTEVEDSAFEEMASEFENNPIEEILSTEVEDMTELEVVEATETMIEENPSEIVTEIASDFDLIETGEVTEAETIEGLTEATSEFVEENSEYIEAAVSDVSIKCESSEDKKIISIKIDGSALLGKSVGVKVSPVNSENELYYIGTTIIQADDGGEIMVEIPEDAVGICCVDVNIVSVMQIREVIAVEEAEDEYLVCDAYLNNAILTGKSKTQSEKTVAIKIIDEEGNIVFLKQLVSNSDGSFSINAKLPSEEMEYIAWVIFDGESEGYIKTFTPTLPNTLTAECNYVLAGDTGAVENVLIYGKNIDDIGKYMYEVDYSTNTNAIEIVDLCAFTYEKELTVGYTENQLIEIISVYDGKIRFVVNDTLKYDGVKAWSELINILKIKKITSENVNVSLRVYE